MLMFKWLWDPAVAPGGSCKWQTNTTSGAMPVINTSPGNSRIREWIAVILYPCIHRDKYYQNDALPDPCFTVPALKILLSCISEKITVPRQIFTLFANTSYHWLNQKHQNKTKLYLSKSLQCIFKALRCASWVPEGVFRLISLLFPQIVLRKKKKKKKAFSWDWSTWLLMYFERSCRWSVIDFRHNFAVLGMQISCWGISSSHLAHMQA